MDLPEMRRVMITGCPGAGKSTAARCLAEITGLPLIHLDRLYWGPGWTRPDPDQWLETVAGIAAEPRWIIDGNYSASMAVRFAAADTLICLDFSTSLCLTRVLRRTIKGWKRSRGEELDPACVERFDWDFLRFVALYRRRHRLRDHAMMSGFVGTRHRFTKPAALAAYLNSLV